VEKEDFRGDCKTMSWSAPGPGRPFGAVEFAAWKAYLKPDELARINQIEAIIRSKPSTRYEGLASAKYEYQGIRNRAFKRANASAEKRAG
jgi:hypothetical protein